MQITKRHIEKVFTKLKLEKRSTTHNYGWLVINGKKILNVHYSHGRGDIPKGVTNKIRSQLKLSQSNFVDLVNCPLTYEKYLEIIKVKGLL